MKTSVNTPTHPLERPAEQAAKRPPPALREQLNLVVRATVLNMTPQQERAACEIIIQCTFYMIGLNPTDYSMCYQASVNKALSTRMLHAMKFRRWGGYKSMNAKMRITEQYSINTRLRYCVPAPVLIVWQALKKLRRVATASTDQLTAICQRYKTHELAQTAIYYYEQFPDQILCIDERFTPDGDLDNFEDISIIASEEISSISSMYETGESNCRPIIPRSSGMQFSTSASYTRNNIGTYMVKRSYSITRQDAQNDLEEIIRPLQDGGMPLDTLAELVTLERLKVLPKIEKALIHLWAINAKHERILDYHDEVQENLVTYNWTVDEEPNLTIKHPSHPAYSVWQNIEEWAKQNPEHLLVPKLIQLHEAFENQMKKGAEIQVYERMEELSREFKAAEYSIISNQEWQSNATNIKIVRLQDLIDDMQRKIHIFGLTIANFTEPNDNSSCGSLINGAEGTSCSNDGDSAPAEQKDNTVT